MYEDNPSLAWDKYSTLEKRFLEFIKFVTIVHEHDEVWSLYLADLLVNIGSSLDSYFRMALLSKSLDDFSGINQIRKNAENADIKTYKQVFESFYKLSERKVFVIPAKRSIQPFQGWANNVSPKWWQVYNDVKHDLFKNKKKATFKNTLEALSGLFLFSVFHRDWRKYLVDIGVIAKGSCGYEFLIETLSNVNEPSDDLTIMGIRAETNLFRHYLTKVPDQRYSEPSVF